MVASQALLEKGVSCRACGATYSYPYRTVHKLCSACTSRYQYWLRGCGTEVLHEAREDNLEHLDRWLTRYLLTSLKRLKKYGIVGSCEAIKQMGAREGEKGFQCGHYAMGLRNGRRVCSAHKRANMVAFVDNTSDGRNSMYDQLEDVLRGLCKKDETIKSIIYKISKDLERL